VSRITAPLALILCNIWRRRRGINCTPRPPYFRGRISGDIELEDVSYFIEHCGM